MDIFYKGKKPELDMPYFGRQSRFFDFFYKCIEPLLEKDGVYAETNSGSVSNAYMFAKKGYKVITNDVSLYSYAIAKAVLSDSNVSSIKKTGNWIDNYTNDYKSIAALFASLIENYGYNPKVPEELNEKLKKSIDYYTKHLTLIKEKEVKAKRIYNEDLFDFLNILEKEKIKVDVMFMDFAWPWRDGTKTEEYDTTANVFSDILGQKNKDIVIWDNNNVIDNVIRAIKAAQKVSKYVLLSNQSSNYPTPEILEVALLKNNINYDIRHTMTTDSEYEDNLGKENYFREYLYVIKGTIE